MANKNVSCRIKLYKPVVAKLTGAVSTALVKTAEAVHTDVVQSQTMPFGETVYTKEKVYGKRGQFAKNGKEYKGKWVKRVKQHGGNLQNDSTFVEAGDAKSGRVRLISATPYARRLYYHPEYNFNRSENPKAGGKWLDAYLPSGKKKKFAQDAFNKFYKEEAGL